MASTSFVILPKDVLLPSASSSSSSPASLPPRRFWRLPHPKTGLPAMYLPYQRAKDGSAGVLEIQNVAPEEERCWFLGEEVVSDGKLLVFTPIDPIFLLLPVLEATTASPSRFLLADHIFSTAASSAAYSLAPPFVNLASDVKQKGKEVAPPPPEGVESDDVLLLGGMEGVEKLMRRVCDVQEIAEGMAAFRLSEKLLVSYLRRKVARLSKQETFERFPSLTRGLAKDGLGDLTADGEGEVVKEEKEGKKLDDLLALKAEARLYQSLSLLKPYLSPTHFTLLSNSYAPSATTQPFPLLTKYLKSLVPVLPPMPTTTSSGGSAASAASKKRKPTQGVAKLAKVDTKGMKTMDSFFKKRVVEDKEVEGGKKGVKVKE
ncbi:ribonuclease H2, subunit B [Mrakia frigida]|uniref:ribonuclease H2, subunit B n=1 Tax=Mrakia frigida TaxID=29902 RepID=UPI003FCC1861